MSGNRIVGGLLALVGAILMLIPLLIHPILGIQAAIQILQLSGFTYFLPWLIIFIVVLLALIGSILAMAGKKGGAILALIMAIVVTIVLILAQFILSLFLLQMATYCLGTTEIYLSLNLVSIIYINIETILLLVGSIIAIPGE
ncbi:MAG: hypothetical protein ACTSRC_17000 [Candidatus Helarchaeota archaeon]